MDKLAVVFPGIGYTTEKPLLYYSRKIAAEQGYEIKVINYSGFPSKIRGDREKMTMSISIALAQAEELFTQIDLPSYEDILFIGKSIGTAVAAKIASESLVKDRIRLIMYTPLEETFAFPVGDSIVFTGTADPWVGNGKSRIPAICEERGIPCTVIPEADHSLETGDTLLDMENMVMIMKETERFVKIEGRGMLR